MKTNPSLLLVASLVGFAPLSAQVQELPPEAVVAVLRTPEELDELLGPVALYPDAMIALILPAATASTDIVLAGRYLELKGNTSGVDEQAWDESVRSLAHYPEVIEWMDENLEWTQQVGEAFLAQPADVMKSIQRLRARARANGTLIDTPQQRILYDVDAIRIVPADPEIIYVPRYDPQIVYVEHRTYYPHPLITFGFGFHIGSWLRYDCDWHHRNIWVVHRDWNWYDRRDWWHWRFHHQLGRGHDSRWNQWRPRVETPRTIRVSPGGPRVDVVRPAPFGERPRRNDGDRNHDDNNRRRENSGNDSRYVRRDAPAPSAPPARTWNDRNDNNGDNGREDSPRNPPPRVRRDDDSGRRNPRPAAPPPAPTVVNAPAAPTPAPAPVVHAPPPTNGNSRSAPRTWGNEIRRSRSENASPAPVVATAPTRSAPSAPPPAPRAAPPPQEKPSASNNGGNNGNEGRRGARTWGNIIRGDR